MPALEGLSLDTASGSESDGGLPALSGNPNRRKFDRVLTSESESESESED